MHRSRWFVQGEQLENLAACPSFSCFRRLTHFDFFRATVVYFPFVTKWMTHLFVELRQSPHASVTSRCRLSCRIWPPLCLSSSGAVSWPTKTSRQYLQQPAADSRLWSPSMSSSSQAKQAPEEWRSVNVLTWQQASYLLEIDRERYHLLRLMEARACLCAHVREEARQGHGALMSGRYTFCCQHSFLLRLAAKLDQSPQTTGPQPHGNSLDSRRYLSIPSLAPLVAETCPEGQSSWFVPGSWCLAHGYEKAILRWRYCFPVKWPWPEQLQGK